MNEKPKLSDWSAPGYPNGMVRTFSMYLSLASPPANTALNLMWMD